MTRHDTGGNDRLAGTGNTSDIESVAADTDTFAGTGTPVEKALPTEGAMKAHFTAEEAAAYMDLPLPMFRVLVTDGALQPVRIKDTYHYRVADIQRFMAKMESGDGDR